MPPTPSSKTATATTEFVCPECGRTFTRAASLGAHRRQTHNVPGATNKTAAQTTESSNGTTARTARRRRARGRTQPARPTSNRPSNSANRDALLQTLFPNGIPAKESVIRSLNAWLDEAERLARLR
jgi:Zinc finger, C2H2 type